MLAGFNRWAEELLNRVDLPGLCKKITIRVLFLQV
jgi:hypothetical protein